LNICSKFLSRKIGIYLIFLALSSRHLEGQSVASDAQLNSITLEQTVSYLNKRIREDSISLNYKIESSQDAWKFYKSLNSGFYLFSYTDNENILTVNSCWDHNVRISGNSSPMDKILWTSISSDAKGQLTEISLNRSKNGDKITGIRLIWRWAHISMLITGEIPTFKLKVTNSDSSGATRAIFGVLTFGLKEAINADKGEKYFHYHYNKQQQVSNFKFGFVPSRGLKGAPEFGSTSWNASIQSRLALGNSNTELIVDDLIINFPNGNAKGFLNALVHLCHKIDELNGMSADPFSK